MPLRWDTEIDDTLALCLAFAFFFLTLAAGIWWVTR